MAECGINEYAKLDDYQPTTAEQRLLQVLLDPANVGKSITEKCQLAGVSRETYYAAMRKEGFVRLKNQLTYDLLKANIDEVLRATFKYAINNPKNNADRKLLLELYGWYTDKKNVELSGPNGEPIRLATLSEEEKKELLKNIARRVANEDESVSDLQISS